VPRVLKRLIFASGAGAVVGAASGLAESIVSFLRQPASETWGAELPAFALAMLIYAPVGVITALGWACLLARLDGPAFARRVVVLSALSLVWFFGGVVLNRQLLPSMTHPLSIVTTLVWTLGFGALGYRTWAGRVAPPDGRDVGLNRVGVAVLATVAVGALLALPSLGGGPVRDEGARKVAAATKRPNVLLIVLDTVRADHLSVYGYSRPTTPGLERLASEGVVFEQALAPAPWTLPSHATLFTGLYPSQHHAGRLHPRLDAHLTTLPEILHEQGYQTVGFSNNTWVSRATNFDQGFDDFEDFRGIWRIWRSLSRLTVVQAYHVFWPTQLHGDHSGGAGVTNKAIRRWFDSRHDPERPFFLFINYLDAHFPYHAPDPYWRKFVEPAHLTLATELLGAKAQDDADWTPPPIRWDATKWGALTDLYDGEVFYLDAMLTELFDDLRARNLWDDTLVVVTSDHGEHLGEHGLFLHRFSVYEPTLRIPMIMRLPGKLPAGQRFDDWVGLPDVFPTILRLLGVPPPPEVYAGLPGKSLVGSPVSVPTGRSLLGDYEVPDNLLPRYRRRTKVTDESYFFRGLRSLHEGNWKLIWGTDGRHELYDLAKDPLETNDLVKQHPEKVKALEARMQAMLEEMPQVGEAEEAGELDAETQDQLRALGYIE
jgi:arylsulfatase A-like enzyme